MNVMLTLHKVYIYAYDEQNTTRLTNIIIYYCAINFIIKVINGSIYDSFMENTYLLRVQFVDVDRGDDCLWNTS